MIKKSVLIILALSFYACAINPQTIDPSINPAERHVWLPSVEDDLEKRRLQQIHLDGVIREIETLFLNLETVVARETNMRSGTKNSISDIEAIDSNRSDQIAKEQERVNILAKEIKEVQLSNKQINNHVVNMYLAPVFTNSEYINAFYYYKRGQYVKSAKLYENMLRLNPPHSLIDNILFGLSMSYYKMKKFSKAEKALLRIIKLYVDSDKWYMSHVMLALVHEKKGEKSQAIYVLEQGLKNDPPYFIRSVINNVINLVQDGPIHAEN